MNNGIVKQNIVGQIEENNKLDSQKNRNRGNDETENNCQGFKPGKTRNGS